MQEVNPSQFPFKSPTFSLLPKPNSLFMSKATSKAEEAQQLLNPQPAGPINITDSLNTGKLSRLVTYIKHGIPSVVLVYSSFSQVL